MGPVCTQSSACRSHGSALHGSLSSPEDCCRSPGFINDETGRLNSLFIDWAWGSRAHPAIPSQPFQTQNASSGHGDTGLRVRPGVVPATRCLSEPLSVPPGMGASRGKKALLLLNRMRPMCQVPICGLRHRCSPGAQKDMPPRPAGLGPLPSGLRDRWMEEHRCYLLSSL